MHAGELSVRHSLQAPLFAGLSGWECCFHAADGTFEEAVVAAGSSGRPAFQCGDCGAVYVPGPEESDPVRGEMKARWKATTGGALETRADS
jgi:hypothetical protein